MRIAGRGKPLRFESGHIFTSTRWSPYDSLLSLTVDLFLSLARSRTCSLRRACATATPTATPPATPPGGALPSARARGLGAEAVHAQKRAFASAAVCCQQDVHGVVGTVEKQLRLIGHL